MKWAFPKILKMVHTIISFIFYNENFCSFAIVGWEVSMTFWRLLRRPGINIEIEESWWFCRYTMGCLPSQHSEKHPQTQALIKGWTALLCTCDFPANTIDGNKNGHIFQNNLILLFLLEIYVFWFRDLVCGYWFFEL